MMQLSLWVLVGMLANLFRYELPELLTNPNVNSISFFKLVMPDFIIKPGCITRTLTYEDSVGAVVWQGWALPPLFFVLPSLFRAGGFHDRSGLVVR
jgi:hypothetical protein